MEIQHKKIKDLWEEIQVYKEKTFEISLQGKTFEITSKDALSLTMWVKNIPMAVTDII